MKKQIHYDHISEKDAFPSGSTKIVHEKDPLGVGIGLKLLSKIENLDGNISNIDSVT